MKPKDLVWLHNPNKWVDVTWGCNCSLVRLSDKDCVVAYYKTDVLTYLLLKCSKGFKVYRVVEFTNRFVAEEVSFNSWIRSCGRISTCTDNSKIELKRISRLRWKVLNKPLFKLYNRELLAEAL